MRFGFVFSLEFLRECRAVRFWMRVWWSVHSICRGRTHDGVEFDCTTDTSLAWST